MPKVRKQKKKKTFKHNINRKRLRNRIENKGTLPSIPIKRAWNNKVSARINLKRMGLAYDANEILKIPSYKETQIKKAKALLSGDFTVTEEPQSAPARRVKTRVVQELEAEKNAPRESSLRLPKSHIDFITYLLDKYGHDYKAMEKDRKNYYQETWRQLRAKIKKFMKMPKEYSKYLESKGQLDNALNENDIKQEAEAMEANYEE